MFQKKVKEESMAAHNRYRANCSKSLYIMTYIAVPTLLLLSLTIILVVSIFVDALDMPKPLVAVVLYVMFIELGLLLWFIADFY